MQSEHKSRCSHNVRTARSQKTRNRWSLCYLWHTWLSSLSMLHILMVEMQALWQEWMWHLGNRLNSEHLTQQYVCNIHFAISKTSPGPLEKLKAWVSSTARATKFSFLKYSQFSDWLPRCILFRTFHFLFIWQCEFFAISQLICTSTSFATLITISGKVFGERSSWCKW